MQQRINSNPEIFNGKPIVRGMRFKVADVLGYLASGMTWEELLTDFPYLEKEDITACLLFAANKIDYPILHIEMDAA